MNDKRIAKIVDEEITKQEAKKYRENKLSIPKKIAEELDSIWDKYISLGKGNDVWFFLWHAVEIDYKTGEKLEKLLPIHQGNLGNIGIAYLTGKALGVEIVEVEG